MVAFRKLNALIGNYLNRDRIILGIKLFSHIELYRCPGLTPYLSPVIIYAEKKLWQRQAFAKHGEF
jgi:hypothetical protein